MDKELQQKIFDKFPKIFPEHLRQGTVYKRAKEGMVVYPIYSGISVMDGWFDLVLDLCSKIQDMVDKEEVGQIVAFQVKEKFGALRFYYVEEGKQTKPHQRINILISAAEKKSMETCEVCGVPGRTENIRHWLKTLCSEHLEKWKEGWRPWRKEYYEKN